MVYIRMRMRGTSVRSFRTARRIIGIILGITFANQYLWDAAWCNFEREFPKNLRGIFRRWGKQLARSEYRSRVRRKEEEEEEDERRRGEEEEGTYLVLAAKEGGWKVNYLWMEGWYTMRGEERERRRVKGWDGTGSERIGCTWDEARKREDEEA